MVVGIFIPDTECFLTKEGYDEKDTHERPVGVVGCRFVSVGDTSSRQTPLVHICFRRMLVGFDSLFVVVVIWNERIAESCNEFPQRISVSLRRAEDDGTIFFLVRHAVVFDAV